MKAKDTVMGQYTIKNTLGLDFGNEVWKTIQPLLIAQAEITWDKAIREVVEWIRANTTENKSRFRSFNGAWQWQAKLKEWGIDDNH